MSVAPDRTVVEIATPRCAAEDFDGEVVALNIDTGIYCSMRGVGADVWRDLAAGHAVEDLASHAPSASQSQALHDFVATLVSHGLVRAAAGAAAPEGAPRSAALLATGQPVAIEVFEDMKSLVLLDPIHETDEDQGWPVKRADE